MALYEVTVTPHAALTQLSALQDLSVIPSNRHQTIRHEPWSSWSRTYANGRSEEELTEQLPLSFRSSRDMKDQTGKWWWAQRGRQASQFSSTPRELTHSECRTHATRGKGKKEAAVRARETPFNPFHQGAYHIVGELDRSASNLGEGQRRRHTSMMRLRKEGNPVRLPGGSGI